jgi:hypothetical protein
MIWNLRFAILDLRFAHRVLGREGGTPVLEH